MFCVEIYKCMVTKPLLVILTAKLTNHHLNLCLFRYGGYLRDAHCDFKEHILDLPLHTE